jgi:hypothetical protein
LGRRNNTHAHCVDPLAYQTELEDEFIAAVKAENWTLATQLEIRLNALDDRPPRMLAAALAYAAWGWPVFPLKPRSKEPATRNGFKDATTDVGTISAWWQRIPDANVGLPTGHRFDVLDVDFVHGAGTVWSTLRDSPDMPTAHGIGSTANMGLHVLLLPTGAGNSARVFDLDGIDYRGKGGYIVAPPSILDGAKRWAWSVKPSPVITGGRSAL